MSLMKATIGIVSRGSDEEFQQVILLALGVGSSGLSGVGVVQLSLLVAK